MRLDEVLLVESPQSDAMHRSRAVKAYDDLLRAVRRINGWEGMERKGQVHVATHMKLRHPEDIALVVWPKQGNQDGGVGVEKRILHLYLDINKDLLMQLKTSHVRTTVVHEFIHLFDSERMKVMNPTNSMGDRAYFNDPIETNAYYQEAIAKFEEMVNRLSDKAYSNMLMAWQSFDRWYGVVSMMVSSDFLNNMSPRTERAFKKRLYQYWDQYVRPMR